MIEEPKITREPSQYDVARSICEALGETRKDAVQQVYHVVWALGRTQARAFLQRTLDIESQGGIMLPDESRRRTPGGIFFNLAYAEGQPKEGRELKRPVYSRPKNTKLPSITSTPQESVKPFDRKRTIEALKTEKGQANVKIVVTGRPGKISEYNGFVVTTMESTKMPALPKGVPAPTNARTLYSVYIGRKQWNKVVEAIKDDSDILVIEGIPTLDMPTSTIAVYATNVTTRNLQIAQKEAQKAKAAEQPATA